MSECTEIREICGDYAFDVKYTEDGELTMIFNSRRNAETVKRCIEVDDSVPNVASAVDFVEVVRCEKCEHEVLMENGRVMCNRNAIKSKTNNDWYGLTATANNHFCSYGVRKEE